MAPQFSATGADHDGRTAEPDLRLLDARQVAQMIRSLGRDGVLCPLVVRGESMRPTLQEGIDTVYLRCVDHGRGVRTGDIALFWRGAHIVLHRVVGKPRAGVFVANGDAQLWREEVLAQDVFAVVEKVKRGNRVMPARSGLLWLWGTCWRLLLPVRATVWRVPKPFKRVVRALGRMVRGGGSAAALLAQDNGVSAGAGSQSTLNQTSRTLPKDDAWAS